MKLVGTTSPRELKITMTVWLVLLLTGATVIGLLRYNRVSILQNLYAVNVGRGSKAQVLYAEAEKYALKALETVSNSKTSSNSIAEIPVTQHINKAKTLFYQAFEWDPRPEFSSEKTGYYELLAQLEDLNGNSSAQLLSNARALMTIEDYDDARDMIARSSFETSSSDAIILLGQLNLLEKKTSEALSVLNRLASLGGVPPKGDWVRGQVYLQVGNIAEARKSFALAVEAQPLNIDYRLDYARTLSLSGDNKKAADIMKSGIESGGWLDPAYLHIYSSFLLQNGDIQEAIRVLKQADELAPYSGDIQWSLAEAYHKAGKHGQASAMLRRAAEINPDFHNKVFEK